MYIDPGTIHGIAGDLHTSGSVLVECGARVSAIEFRPEQAGRAHTAEGAALRDGFARLGRILAAWGANASSCGAVLSSNAGAAVAADTAFADRAAEVDR